MYLIFTFAFSVLAFTSTWAREPQTPNLVDLMPMDLDPALKKALRALDPNHGLLQPKAANKRAIAPGHSDPIELNLRLDFGGLGEVLTDNELEKAFPRMREILTSSTEPQADAVLKQIGDQIQSLYLNPQLKNILNFKLPSATACSENSIRQDALLAFLMREYEAGQRFNEKKQPGRQSAMDRFEREFHENFLAQIGHTYQGSEAEVEQFKKFGKTMQTAAASFARSNVQPEAKRDPQVVFTAMSQSLAGKACSPGSSFRSIADAMSKVDWSKQTNRSQILNRILFDKIVPEEEKDSSEALLKLYAQEFKGHLKNRAFLEARQNLKPKSDREAVIYEMIQQNPKLKMLIPTLYNK